MRMAWCMQPLFKKLVQWLPICILHYILQIFGIGIASIIYLVIGANALPEQLITHFPAKHVQYPAAFLVAVGIQQLHVIIFHSGINNRCKPLLFKLKYIFPVLFKALL